MKSWLPLLLARTKDSSYSFVTFVALFFFTIVLFLVAQPLTNALKHTGQCYEAIGELYAEQPQCDWNPFLTGLNEYKAVLSTFPGILSNQKVKIVTE